MSFPSFGPSPHASPSEDHRDTEPPAAPPTDPAPRRPRGFASWDQARLKEVAGKGGRTAHANGNAHEFTHEEAVAAGRKGGLASKQRRR